MKKLQFIQKQKYGCEPLAFANILNLEELANYEILDRYQQGTYSWEMNEIFQEIGSSYRIECCAKPFGFITRDAGFPSYMPENIEFEKPIFVAGKLTVFKDDDKWGKRWKRAHCIGFVAKIIFSEDNTYQTVCFWLVDPTSDEKEVQFVKNEWELFDFQSTIMSVSYLFDIRTHSVAVFTEEFFQHLI